MIDRNMGGECYMLSKYGEVYDCIDGTFHPNPGTEETKYSEIERTIDWIMRVPFYQIIEHCKVWLKIRVAQEMYEFPNESLDDIILNVMYSDLYEPCNLCLDTIKECYEEFIDDPFKIDSYAHSNDIKVASEITSWLNETFTRVRIGGKFNPNGKDAIYFRISSHGYDWHRTIVDFLWDKYGDTKKMPRYIWIGHDAETNPPEVTLFDGTPEELFNQYDDKIFSNYQLKREKTVDRYKLGINKDNLKYKLDKLFSSCSKIKYQ